MSARSKTIVILAGIVALAVVAIVIVLQVFRGPDTLSNACVEVLPQDKRVGLKVQQKGNDVTVDFSGQRGVQSGATPEQINAFVKCLEATMKKPVSVENGVRLPLEPVGEVMSHWKRDGGLQLRLLPGTNTEALYNLRIGPAVGLKEHVIADWCGPAQAGDCVTCDPPQPTSQTNEVVVRLKEGAPVHKRQLDGLWPAGPPGVQPEPWQLVNDKGERFYYECVHRSAQSPVGRAGR